MFHVSAWQALGDMASFREHVSLSQNVLAVWGPFWLKLSQNSFLGIHGKPLFVGSCRGIIRNQGLLSGAKRISSIHSIKAKANNAAPP